jgi:trehalose 6-phosphate synthase
VDGRSAPLVVAANRGPVQLVEAADGRVETRRGSGGLVTALRPLLRSHAVRWVCSATTPAERAAAGTATTVAVDDASVALHPVAVDPAAYEAFYDTAANPVLWFVQHGLAGLLAPGRAAAFPRAWETGYRVVDDAFADAVVTEARRAPGARVLLQDYHLYLAPARVRAALPEVAIGHFTHIPWPTPDAWAPVPPAVVREVHASLLACDSVGFHVDRWRDAFVACCSAFLGREADAAAAAHVNPIAVDPSEFAALARSDTVQAHVRELEAGRPPLRVLRVDRTDPSKNAVRGFEAFALLLERRPDLRGRVELVALLDPSRQTIPEYQAYRAALEAAARRIEERFGAPGARAVTLSVRDDFAASVAAYVDYDVLLANSVRDGMNLVALEAPLVNRRDGVVVLSTETGARDVLGAAAIAVDPLDVPATADAIGRALDLVPDERRARAAALRRAAGARTTADWIAGELDALDRGARRSGRVPSS